MRKEEFGADVHEYVGPFFVLDCALLAQKITLRSASIKQGSTPSYSTVLYSTVWKGDLCRHRDSCRRHNRKHSALRCGFRTLTASDARLRCAQVPFFTPGHSLSFVHAFEHLESMHCTAHDHGHTLQLRQIERVLFDEVVGRSPRRKLAIAEFIATSQAVVSQDEYDGPGKPILYTIEALQSSEACHRCNRKGGGVPQQRLLPLLASGYRNETRCRHAQLASHGAGGSKRQFY